MDRRVILAGVCLWGTFEARQYDPRTGGDVSLGVVSGGDWRSFDMPDSNDWIVHLK
jgi:hypothetical protein